MRRQLRHLSLSMLLAAGFLASGALAHTFEPADITGHSQVPVNLTVIQKQVPVAA